MTRYQFVMGAVAALATAGLGWNASANQADDSAKAGACCCGDECNCEECGCCDGCKDGECTCGDDCTCEGCDCCSGDCSGDCCSKDAA